MQTMAWIFQVLAAAAAGVLTVRLIRSVAHHDWDPLTREVSQAARGWPRQAAWLAPVVPFAFTLTRQFIRPSSRLRLELRLAGASPAFTDREFLVMAWTLLVCTAVVFLSLLAAVAALTGHLPQAPWWVLALAMACAVGILPRIRLRDIAQQRRQEVQRGFPTFLDGLALTLESGLNFQSALQLSVQRLPRAQGGLQGQLQEVLRDIRAGQGKVAALQRLSERLQLPEMSQFVASMIASERQGVSITALLRRQSEQLRLSRALAAERHAMKLPVKLLAPLALCIFPCTFLVLAFPIGIRLSQSGLFS